jgi:hypothetical protein
MVVVFYFDNIHGIMFNFLKSLQLYHNDHLLQGLVDQKMVLVV